MTKDDHIVIQNFNNRIVKDLPILRPIILDFYGEIIENECFRVYKGISKLTDYLIDNWGFPQIYWFISTHISSNAGALLGKSNTVGIIKFHKGLILGKRNLFLGLNIHLNESWGQGRLFTINKLLNFSVEAFMFDTSVLFSYYHELAHIIQLKNCNPFQRMIRVKKKPLEGRETRIKTYLEFDSDTFSTLMIADHFRINFIEKTIKNQGYTGNSIGDLVAIFVLPIYVTILNFTGYDNEIIKFNGKHPHPRIRNIVCTIMAINQCIHFLKEFDNKLFFEPLDIFKTMITVGDITYQNDEKIKSKLKMDEQAIADFDVSAFIEEINLITDNNSTFASTIRKKVINGKSNFF